MKALKTIALGALAAATIACTSTNTKQYPFEIEAPLPSQSLIDSVSYFVGFNFGYFIKDNGFGQDMVNMNLVKKGMEDYFKASSPRDTNAFMINPMDLDAAVQKYLRMMSERESEITLKECQSWLDANKEKEGVEVTESGLQYKIITEGSELKPTSLQDTVKVIYRGTLIDGTEFDSSNGQPIEFTLNRVIKGWGEGMQKIGVGGKAELYIPAELAYGSRRMSTIKPNSTLIFEVELVEVRPYVEKAETK